MKLQPVILAGGNGSRLWPLSQRSKPKQFIKHFNNLSLFQNTILRNAYLGTPLIMANITHQVLVTDQLKEINSKAQVIFEPEPKNTATCALVASYYTKKQGGDSIILIPTDHHIEDEIKYKHALKTAIHAIKKYNFSVIGIKPSYPNSNFGYIKTIQKIKENFYLASQFIEKPSKKLTAKFANLPGYLWNSGIYFFNLNYFLDLANKFMPDTNKILSQAFNNSQIASNGIILEKKLYVNLLPLSFDKVFSEKLEQMAVVKGDFKWEDLGSWEAVWNLDKNYEYYNNRQEENRVIVHDVENSYINSDATKTVVIGLKDLVIVFKNGQLLVANKDSIESMGSLIANGFKEEKTEIF